MWKLTTETKYPYNGRTDHEGTTERSKPCMTKPWYQDEKAALERELDDDTTCNNGKKSVGTNTRSFHLTTDY